MQEKLAYTVAEAAETMGLSERKMRQLLMEGAIASRKVGSRRLVPRRALEVWLGGGSTSDPGDADPGSLRMGR